ncbi:unnamed protein product [Spirodela intermedia]|uniref:Uncharacterized protein n=2 Tax=Spirodela intermedia TaxID=51605 RepID=A0A7I8IUS8_SPIIN|nr:unnamed protein product [Spirodela intermedia]CAA6661627.1 unnamed protein product [Spirodela intermedia]CAA7398003.1 unnamed protein product [Spirodela intermedia]
MQESKIKEENTCIKHETVVWSWRKKKS